MSFGNICRNKTKKIAHTVMVCLAVFVIVSLPVVKSIFGSNIKTGDIVQVEDFAEINEDVGRDVSGDIETFDISSELEAGNLNSDRETIDLLTPTGSDAFLASVDEFPEPLDKSNKEEQDSGTKSGLFDGLIQLFGFGDEEEEVPNTVEILRGLETCRAIDSSEVTGSSMTVTGATTLADINTWIAGLATDDNLLTFTDNFALTGAINTQGKNITIQSSTGLEIISRDPAFTTNMMNIEGGIVVLSNIIFDGENSTNPVTGTMIRPYSNAVLYVENCTELRNNETTTSGGAINASNGEVVMDGGLIHGNNTELHGGGIFASYITMNGGTITENNAGSSGGGVYATNMIMEDGTISYNTARTYYDEDLDENNKPKGNRGGGAGICADDLVMNGGLVEENETLLNEYRFSTSSSGGGLLTRNLVINGGTITANKATIGAGIAMTIDGNNTVDITGGEISNNIAAESTVDSVTYNSAGGGISTAYSTLSVSGGSIFNNTANLGGGIYSSADSMVNILDGALIYSNDAVWGGAMYIVGSFSMTGGVVGGSANNANTATSGGGAMYSTANTLNISGGEISYNTSSLHAGAIYTYSNSIVNIFGDASMYSNTATDTGGAMFGHDSTEINIYGSASVHSNSAKYAAGLYNSDINSEINVYGSSSIHSNSATIWGGGLYLRGTANISGGNIYSNTSTHGGGVFGDATSTINISDNASIYSNTVTDYGGGVYSNSAVNITGGVIGGASNKANTAVGGGGVFGFSSSTISISGGEISFNTTSSSGGGVQSWAGSTVNISDNALIHSNSARTYGGGIFANGTVNMTGGVIGGTNGLANTAATGGGLFSDTSSTVGITSGEISFNTATSYGGGIFGNTSTSTVNISGDASIYSNTATLNGGGVYTTGVFNVFGGASIYSNRVTTTSSVETNGNGGGIFANSSSNVTIYGSSSIYSNSARNSGGGVYGYINSTVKIKESASIYSNSLSATTSYGGGVCSDGTLNIEGGVIGGASGRTNTATYGGGVYVETRTLTMTGGDVSYNENGGIYISSSVTANISGGEIHHNTRTAGGGVYGSTSATVNILGDAKIYSNTASTGGGGGFYAAGIANISGGEIYSNTAATYGGGVYGGSSSTIKISDDASIYMNTASSGGGGVYVTGRPLVMTGGDISYNNGNGILMNSTGVLNISGGDIHHNSSQSLAGGGIYGNANTKLNISGTVSIYSNETGTYGGGIYSTGITNISGGNITNNSATSYGNGVYFPTAASSTLNLSGNPQIGIDNDDNGVWFAQGKEATVIGDLDATARINIEGVVTDTDVTVIANKIDNETDQTPVNAFQTEAEKFVYIPGLTSDPIVSVIPSTTTYILSDPLYIDLEITGDTNIDITPSFNHSNGVVSSIKQTASFTTNIVTGVTMSISLDDTTSDLVNAVDNTRTVPSINSTIDSPSQLTTNTWGFGLTDRILETNNSNSTTTWAKLPNQSDANPSTVIKTTSIHNRTEPNTTDIFFGAKINTDQLAGTYLTTLIYTIVGNL